MTKPVSRVKFALRFGGDVLDFGGTWTYFEDTIGYIEDWAGLLSEGAVAGDIIEQDWVDGAQWQRGKRKTYSFDVPYTALVPAGTVEPNIWESFNSTTLLNAFRGPQLTLRREFIDKNGNTARVDQAIGVLATDLAAEVGIGRVIHSVAIFQNLSGYWRLPLPKAHTLVETFDSFNPEVWSVTAGITAQNGQCVIAWSGAANTQQLVTKETFDLTASTATIDAVSLSNVKYDNLSVHPLVLWNSGLSGYVSFRVFNVSGVPTMTASTAGAGGGGFAPEVAWSSTTHRWLRISETAGTIYWLTSADRTTWSTFFSMASSSLTTWDPRRIRIGIQSVTSATVTVPTNMSNVSNVDNLNTVGTRTLASNLVDNFNTGLDTKRWSASPNVVVTAGVCDFVWDGTIGVQFLISKPVFNLVGSAVYMRLTSAIYSTKIPNYYPLIIWNESMSHYVCFLMQPLGGNLTLMASSNTPGGVGGPVPTYVPATHAWLRIREAAGNMLYFETSANGTTWTTLINAPWTGMTGWSPTAVRIGVARATPSSTNVGMLTLLQVDNYNTLS